MNRPKPIRGQGMGASARIHSADYKQPKHPTQPTTISAFSRLPYFMQR